jgi:hypothetical protein
MSEIEATVSNTESRVINDHEKELVIKAFSCYRFLIVLTKILRTKKGEIPFKGPQQLNIFLKEQTEVASTEKEVRMFWGWLGYLGIILLDGTVKLSEEEFFERYGETLSEASQRGRFRDLK